MAKILESGKQLGSAHYHRHYHHLDRLVLPPEKSDDHITVVTVDNHNRLPTRVDDDLGEAHSRFLSLSNLQFVLPKLMTTTSVSICMRPATKMPAVQVPVTLSQCSRYLPTRAWQAWSKKQSQRLPRRRCLSTIEPATSVRK